MVIFTTGTRVDGIAVNKSVKLVHLSGTFAVTNTCPGCSERLHVIICVLSSKRCSLVNWHYPTSPTGNVDDQSMMFWRTFICKHTSLYCYFTSPTSISQAVGSISYLTTLQDLCPCGVQIISLPRHSEQFWITVHCQWPLRACNVATCLKAYVAA